MSDDTTARSGGLGPVTKIITSYVGNHTVPPDQLSALIISVDQAIRNLGTPVQQQPLRLPAVPIKRSVQHGHVVCLDRKSVV